MAESGGSLRPLTLSRVLFCRSRLWLLLRKQPHLSVAVSVTGLDFRAQFCLHSFIYNLILPSLPTLYHRLPPSGVRSIVPPLLLPRLTLPSSPTPPFFFGCGWVGLLPFWFILPSFLGLACHCCMRSTLFDARHLLYISPATITRCLIPLPATLYLLLPCFSRALTTVNRCLMFI